MEKYTLKPEDIKLIGIDSETTLFFHAETMQIYPIQDVELIDFLKSLQKYGEKEICNFHTNENYKLLNSFISKTISTAPDSLIWRHDDDHEIEFNTVVLPIASSCNLNCPYCFAQTDGGFRFGNYTVEGIKKTLDFVVSKNKAKQKNCFWIVFFGGEPLLNFETIQFTVEYMKNSYPDFSVAYSMTTNGTILTTEMIDLLRVNNVAALVSLDGPDNEYNLRRYRNGESSIKQVLTNIEKLRQNNIRTELRATLINSNPYICETFDFFEKLKIPFFVSFAYTSENKSHNLSEYSINNLSSIKKQFDSLTAYYKNKLSQKEEVFNKHFFEYISTIRFRQKKNLSCGAGRGYFTITSNGDIFTCPHFMNDSRYCIGNIETAILEKKSYTSVQIDKINECENCWVKHLCLGHCLAQKVSLGKSNDTSLPANECELQKIVYEFYIKLFYFAKTYRQDLFVKDQQDNKSQEMNINC